MNIPDDQRTTVTFGWFADGHDGDGWYYWEDEYPEEGSTGAFGTKAEAVAHAKDAGYNVTDAVVES